MTTLDTSLKWQWLRGLAFWNRQPIRAQGGWLALIPVVAILASFALAFYGYRNRELLETDIERKFQTATKLDELNALVVNAETGLRGYLLTGRSEFLEPYKTARRDIPPTLAELKQAAESDPNADLKQERLKRLREIEIQINRQLDVFEQTGQTAFARQTSVDELFDNLQRDKTLMDELRAKIKAVQSDEDFWLSQSLNQINSVRQRDYLFVVAALLIGLLARVVSFYLFDRGIVRRIERITENARCLQRGETFKFPISNKKDAVGCLEEEIENLSQILGKNDNLKEST